MPGVTKIGVLTMALLTASTATFRALPRRTVLDDGAIRQILIDRVDTYKQSVGLVVGVIEPRGQRVIAYGRVRADDPRPLNGDTVFEVGSITKVFTSLLLAAMVERGEVSLEDPAVNYLPDDIRLPERDGRQIQLQNLATHTSGLPRMPTNVSSRDPQDPFADYSTKELYEFLSSYRLPYDVGSTFEYSNLGGALLGHVLERRAGTDYGSLVESLITAPLRMTSTSVELTPAMKARLASGHSYMLEPTPNWNMGALAAAGALHSTANDLLTFLAANLGYIDTPLATAMAAMLKVRRETGEGKVALGWFTDTQDGIEIVNHSGLMGGYTSFIGFDPMARVGVVVLSNTGAGSVRDIGMHLLNPSVPLLDGRTLAPPQKHTEIPINPALLANYTGLYRFPASRLAKVTSEDGHLCLQSDGEVKIAFYPESDTAFFARLINAQIVFTTENGKVTDMLFIQDGISLEVRRIE